MEHAVADVTNTPWKERHAYVLGPPGVHVVDKAMHVSPFFGMDQSLPHHLRRTVRRPPPVDRRSTRAMPQVFAAGLRSDAAP